ncbi:hypothetical protein ColTof4_01005 [Colletotrichum tofieldiae]|uniref:Uncharacterized protein n=1 Tax=Colletotrichum tofieldiae TaxID=708197 RepID=A0A166U2Z5_9PEZI|nr:hypothetical protein CT0861_12031 [Colletotrichum tofieldiae]GKT60886.1 hypothetical protein ColTof3_08225 [Colletotrichum tofieldiae]GKT68582.1 hypothetical protein ColTof4_01005 [Colletotrichum tofieldiae]GKT90388.1 hypothetical protein Ct61P_08238 [Colletotrichum tofieldiae]
MKCASLPLAAALLAGASSAFQVGKPPVPQAKTTMADNFPWRDPFTSKTTDAYASACESSKTFPATQYTLHDLFDKPPTGLFQYGDGLKAFFSGREYPGGWAGLDRHMYDRNVLMMEYADVPVRVREWIEEQERADGEGKGLFAVFDKPATDEEKVTERVAVPDAARVDRGLDAKRVAIFAPGALYPVLPLFVADGSDCQAALADLGNYQAVPGDAAVVAWPVSHTRPDVANHKRDIEFTVKARVLKRKEAATEGDAEEKAAAAPSEPAKDEL